MKADLEVTRADVERAAHAALQASQRGIKRMPSKTLHECLAQTMAEVGYVQKDATNDFQRYKYASAEAVLRKVNTSLSSQGVCCASTAELVSHETIQGPKKATFHAIVKLSLTFHKGSDQITVSGLGSGSDSGDKSVMKANTAALKYCLANAFLISWGDDPEADVETDKRASEPRSNGKPRAKPSARASASPSPSLEPIDGLCNRIEAHTDADALSQDRELAEACRAHTGEAHQRLKMTYLRHERALREEGPRA
jgi:hypothetical protein